MSTSIIIEINLQTMLMSMLPQVNMPISLLVSDHGGGSGLGVRRLPADPRAVPVGVRQGGRVRLEVPAGNSCNN